jgi:hypothetical protein
MFWGVRGDSRARLRRRIVPPPTHFHTRFANIFGSSISERQCDRTLGLSRSCRFVPPLIRFMLNLRRDAVPLQGRSARKGH